MEEINEMELQEKVMQLKYEVEDKTSEVLRLKKENERLYQSVKTSVEQASAFRTELEENKRFYTKRIEELAEEKAKLSKELDVTKAEYDRVNSTYTSATNARDAVRREFIDRMDRVRETSMDAVTMIDYIQKDIKKLKLDLDNMSRSESTTQSDIEDEIQLMLDLLNTHYDKLKTIKSGFYSINKIKEYENQGIIKGYQAVVNWEGIDDSFVEALIELKVTPKKETGFDEMAKMCMAFEEVESVYLMAGVYDFALIVRGETMQDIAMFIAKKLSTIDGVISTGTHFIMRRYKDRGMNIFNEDAQADERSLIL